MKLIELPPLIQSMSPNWFALWLCFDDGNESSWLVLYTTMGILINHQGGSGWKRSRGGTGR